MPMCPLSTDWGNVADWFAVVVAAAGAVAVWLVTKASNSTARASHELARQMKQREEDVRQRDRAVLAALIYGGVLESSTGYGQLLEEISSEGFLTWLYSEDGNLDRLRVATSAPQLAHVEKEVGRFNLLPLEVGKQIAMGIALSRGIPAVVDLLSTVTHINARQSCIEQIATLAEGAKRAFAAAEIGLSEVMLTDGLQEPHAATPNSTKSMSSTFSRR